MPIIVSGPTNVSAHDDGVALLHVGEHAVRPYPLLAIDTIPRMNGKGKSGYCSFYRGNVLYERNEYDLMNADGGWHAYISW